MTFVSVAEAARRLGIDAKTLHHWLAEAQLPLQRHPHDGRKQGVSSEHLQVLARRHQRRLAPFQEEAPASGAADLPAALLALPETLGTLQAQVAALQQQVAALTHLLQQHVSEPARPAAPPKPLKASKRSPKPPSPAPTEAPARPVHVLPRVEYGSEGHYVVICPKQGLLAVEPDSPAWFRWLMTLDSFRFVGRAGHFTAHHESARVLRGAWRAQRKIRNHSYNVRLAPGHQLTIAVLEQAAATLQAHLD